MQYPLLKRPTDEDEDEASFSSSDLVHNSHVITLPGWLVRLF
jgi:hypothetical protein